MKPGTGSAFRLAGSLRATINRFAFLFLIVASFLLMLLSKAEVVVIERLRTTIADIGTPVFEVLSKPADALASAAADVRELVHLREENDRLREEVARLERWQEAARRLDGENQSLRALLNFQAEPPLRYATARVVADSSGAYRMSLLVAAGTEQGVAKGQAAVAGDGLVGRVTEVGARSARVLLITDINSHIPVMVESTHERAVLSGDNGPLLKLLYLASDSKIASGDRIVTSGYGGVFPAGLPVGLVQSVGEHGVVVQPFVDWSRLEFIRLLDYGLPGILPPQPAIPIPPTKGRRQ